MQVYLSDVLLGRIYKKIPDATYTYICCTIVKDYLLNLLGNVEVANLIALHVTQLTRLLSEPAYRLNLIEKEDKCLFDIGGKCFIKESGTRMGSPRAFIRWEYSESKKLDLASFIEVTYFHFPIFLNSNQLNSNLKEGPKDFYLHLLS